MELGRELVEELEHDAGPEVDTLSRWMAHYIAELIIKAETASADNKQSALEECADAILKLWDHRHSMPKGTRPFESIESIQRALESLDPESNTPRYFRNIVDSAKETKEVGAAKNWLITAERLDDTAKSLIRYCLTQAAQNALEKSEKWVGFVEALGSVDDIDFTVIRLIFEERDLLSNPEPDDMERNILEERINRLDEFTKMADALLTDFRRQFNK